MVGIRLHVWSISCFPIFPHLTYLFFTGSSRPVLDQQKNDVFARLENKYLRVVFVDQELPKGALRRREARVSFWTIFCIFGKRIYTSFVSYTAGFLKLDINDKWSFHFLCAILKINRVRNHIIYNSP